MRRDFSKPSGSSSRPCDSLLLLYCAAAIAAQNEHL
jgi:hypothetical protein